VCIFWFLMFILGVVGLLCQYHSLVIGWKDTSRKCVEWDIKLYTVTLGEIGWLTEIRVAWCLLLLVCRLLSLCICTMNENDEWWDNASTYVLVCVCVIMKITDCGKGGRRRRSFPRRQQGLLWGSSSPLWHFKPARVKPNSARIRSTLARAGLITASDFNQLSQYTCSSKGSYLPFLPNFGRDHYQYLKVSQCW